MPSAGFELATPATKRPYTYVLDDATTGIGCPTINISEFLPQSVFVTFSEYSSYSFTTSALDGVEWSASRRGRALPPGKGPTVPIVQEAG
jgi:hypothetical protein